MDSHYFGHFKLLLDQANNKSNQQQHETSPIFLMSLIKNNNFSTEKCDEQRQNVNSLEWSICLTDYKFWYYTLLREKDLAEMV